MCKADACFSKERLGDCRIEAATAATLSDPVLVLDGQDFFPLKPMMFVESWKPTGVLFFLLVRDHDDLMKSVFGKERCVAMTD